MLNFNLQNPFTKPALRQPRLNLLHPFYSKNIQFAGVAQAGGVTDLLTGNKAVGTTTLSGTDENGHYVWSNDGAGTATCSFAGLAINYEFQTFGCIFKLIGTSLGWIFTVQTSNTGFVCNGLAIDFELSNTNDLSLTGQAGHTYFVFMTNCVATAALQRFMVLLDLVTGQRWVVRQTGAGNVVFQPITALTIFSSDVCHNRFYAGFACGSVLIPPAVNPAATFYSIDQIMAGMSDPWSLWYA
jgi:hypothetical protein